VGPHCLILRGKRAARRAPSIAETVPKSPGGEGLLFPHVPHVPLVGHVGHSKKHAQKILRFVRHSRPPNTRVPTPSSQTKARFPSKPQELRRRRRKTVPTSQEDGPQFLMVAETGPKWRGPEGAHFPKHSPGPTGGTIPEICETRSHDQEASLPLICRREGTKSPERRGNESQRGLPCLSCPTCGTNQKKSTEKPEVCEKLFSIECQTLNTRNGIGTSIKNLTVSKRKKLCQKSFQHQDKTFFNGKDLKKEVI
jgi:hypothetical protein